MAYTAVIITLSDRASQGVYEDKTGPALQELLEKSIPLDTVEKQIIPDEQAEL